MIALQPFTGKSKPFPSDCNSFWQTLSEGGMSSDATSLSQLVKDEFNWFEFDEYQLPEWLAFLVEVDDDITTRFSEMALRKK